MKKEKEYTGWFSPEAIHQAELAFNALKDHGEKGKVNFTYRVTQGGESWSYDSAEDFFEAYGPDIADAKFTKKSGPCSLYVSYSRELNSTKIAVGAPGRKSIEDIFAIFEAEAKG